MKRKGLLILILLFWGFNITYSQKSFDFTVGGGAYFTPINKPIVSSGYFNAEMEYHHNMKVSFSAGLITARYLFKSDGSWTVVNGIPVRNGTELQSNFLVKYNLLKSSKNYLKVGAGLGLLTYGKEVEIESKSLGTFIINQSNTDLGFPLVVEFDRRISKRIILGGKFGTFIFPDYPIVGNNFGLQLKYKIY